MTGNIIQKLVFDLALKNQEASTSVDPTLLSEIGIFSYITEHQITTIRQHLLHFE